MVGFIFGGDTAETPDSLKRKREIAAAMLGRASSAPRNVGEGLSAIGNALIYRGLTGDIEKGEAAGRKSADEAFAPLAALLGGGSSSSMPSPGAAGEISSTSPAPSGSAGPDIAATESYIRDAATKRGIDPDIAVKVARSEGLAPGVWQSNVVRGDGRRETSYGPFQLLVGGGLGDKFQKLYGKSPSDPSTVNQQIDFALDEAATGGWSPWYGAAKVGVGARTGLDSARALGVQPAQVASNDPSIGMPAAAGQMAATSPQPAPLPQPAAATPEQAPAPRQQVAQALTAPQQPQQVDTGAIMKALSNPFLPQGQRAVAQALLERELGRQNTLYEQQLKQADPAYQLGLQKDQLEIDNLRNPRISPADQANLDLNRDKFNFEKGKPTEVGGRLIGNDGKVIYEPPRDPMKVGAKETVIDPNNGKVIYQPAPGQAVDFNDVSGLRKEIQQLPSYKNYSQALPIYRSMAETAGRSSKASDLNLVYGLGKIMDPTSVVREGEMVMVKNTASLPDWLQGAISSLNGGGALAPATREAIMREAYGRVQGYDQAFQQDAGQYRGIVERNKFNPADVIPDFGTYEPWKAAAAPPENPLPPTPGAIGTDWAEVSPGVRIRKKGQ